MLSKLFLPNLGQPLHSSAFKGRVDALNARMCKTSVDEIDILSHFYRNQLLTAPPTQVNLYSV
jgi:hypothetical protein